MHTESNALRKIHTLAEYTADPQDTPSEQCQYPDHSWEVIEAFAEAQQIVVDAIGLDADDELLGCAYDALLESQSGDTLQEIIERTLHNYRAMQTDEALPQETTVTSPTQRRITPPRDELTRRREALLTGKEDSELCQLYTDGDMLAATVLLDRYMRMIHMQARKFRNKIYYAAALSHDDLVQQGSIAFLESAKKFDGLRGFAFSTYFYMSVFRDMHRHIQNLASTIRIPAHIREDISKLENINNWRRSHKRPLLNAEQISELFGRIPLSSRQYDVRTVDAIGRWILMSEHMGSLDGGYSPRHDFAMDNEYVLDERHALINLTIQPEPEPDELASAKLETEALSTFLDTLDEREKFISKGHFGIGTEDCTLEELGRRLGLTRERIRQIEMRALKKLRAASNRNYHAMLARHTTVDT